MGTTAQKRLYVAARCVRQGTHPPKPHRHVIAWPAGQLTQKRLLFLQSLDTSQEIPVYVFKVAKALQRVLQQNDAELQQVRCCPALLLCFRSTAM